MNILMSYHYWNDPGFYKKMHRAGCNILLDSGAFSAYTIGAHIGIDEYCEFIKKVEPFVDGYIQLDKVYDQETSVKNLEYMEKIHQLNPIPVWQGVTGNFSGVAEWTKGRPWVAISGAAGAKGKNKGPKDWVWRRALSFKNALPNGVKWHFLGVTAEKRLSQLRPSTYDSSSIDAGFVYGTCIDFFSPHYGKMVSYNLRTGSENSYESLDAARLILNQPNLPFNEFRARKIKDLNSDFSWGRALACYVSEMRAKRISKKTGAKIYHAVVPKDTALSILYLKGQGIL